MSSAFVLLKYFPILLGFLLGLVNALVQIQLPWGMLTWEECILRKKLLPVDEKDPCYRCSMNPSSGTPVEKQGWNQKYINCSEHCDHITVCTEAKYYTMVGEAKDPILIPVCYQCENRKSEEVYFVIIRHDELCSQECLHCAQSEDILTATYCARYCDGFPTFCYPIERWYNVRSCYQAEYWYGCYFSPLGPEQHITNECMVCAKAALNPKDAQECAVDCDGLPSYTLTSSDNTSSIVQCDPLPKPELGDFLYYDIPRNIGRHMHVSNPGNIYPVQDLMDSYLSSFVAKRIFRKFNMTLLTWPRPPGYENITL